MSDTLQFVGDVREIQYIRNDSTNVRYTLVCRDVRKIQCGRNDSTNVRYTLVCREVREIQCGSNESQNVRYTLEALAKFTIDATALRRGDSRSQLQQQTTIRF